MEVEEVESLVLEMTDMDVEPEVVGMEADNANDVEIVTMELEKEGENQELDLTTIKLLKHREDEADQELELTTMELEEGETGITDMTDLLVDGQVEQVDPGDLEVTIPKFTLTQSKLFCINGWPVNTGSALEVHTPLLCKSENIENIENQLSPKTI